MSSRDIRGRLTPPLDGRNTGFRWASLGLALLLTLAIVGWTVGASNAARGLQEAETPTPTATKPPVRNEIASPRDGDVIFGVWEILGTALIDNFQGYQLHVSPAGAEAWSWLHTGYNPVCQDPSDFATCDDATGGLLYRLDTTRLADGFYDFRLRVIRVDGNYTESFAREVEVRNQNPPTPTPVAVTLTPGSPLATPSPLGTPTPTPIPTEASFLPGGQGVYSPASGAKLGSYARIVGTANGRDPGHRFLRYELYLSPAGQENWNWLFSSQKQLFNDVLYVLDTTKLPNGAYDLRLRIVYRDSNYDEYFVRNLVVENDVEIIAQGRTVLQVDAPRDGSVISQQMAIRGTIYDPQLARWELYWRANSPDDAGGWLFLFSGDYPVIHDLIAQVDLRHVPSGLYDVRLRLVRRDGNFQETFVRRLHAVPPTPTPYPNPHRR